MGGAMRENEGTRESAPFEEIADRLEPIRRARACREIDP
jgi:hypothetical protein